MVATVDHKYYVDGVEVAGNTNALRAVGLGHGFGNEFDMQRGKNAHLATRLYDERRLDWTTVSTRIEPYLAGWIAFRKISGFEPVWIERAIYCKRYGFATRLDRMGWLNGRRVVIQIKTGGLDVSVGPQTAGEALAAQEVLGCPVDRFAVVLPGDRWFDLQPLTSRADFPEFLSAVASWNYRRARGWDGRTSNSR